MSLECYQGLINDINMRKKKEGDSADIAGSPSVVVYKLLYKNCVQAISGMRGD